jgi:hypothetical protein
VTSDGGDGEGGGDVVGYGLLDTETSELRELAAQLVNSSTSIGTPSAIGGLFAILLPHIIAVKTQHDPTLPPPPPSLEPNTESGISSDKDLDLDIDLDRARFASALHKSGAIPGSTASPPLPHNTGASTGAGTANPSAGAGAGAGAGVVVSKLFTLRSRVKERRLHFHVLAVNAYFKFLSLGNSNGNGNSDTASSSSGTGTGGAGDADTLSCMLRLIRMLVKVGTDIPAHMAHGLAATPIAPWQAVVPQLLSRLGHPTPFVAREVLKLLIRLARAAPYLLVYPALVGTQSIQQNKQRGQHQGQAGGGGGREEEKQKEESASSVSSAAASPPTLPSASPPPSLSPRDVGMLELRSALTKSYPQLVHQVSSLMSELNRLTADRRREQWYALLTSLSRDVSTRCRTLAREAVRTAGNFTLSASAKRDIARERYAAVMTPIRLRLAAMLTRTLGEGWAEREGMHDILAADHQQGGSATTSTSTSICASSRSSGNGKLTVAVPAPAPVGAGPGGGGSDDGNDDDGNTDDALAFRREMGPALVAAMRAFVDLCRPGHGGGGMLTSPEMLNGMCDCVLYRIVLQDGTAQYGFYRNISKLQYGIVWVVTGCDVGSTRYYL